MNQISTKVTDFCQQSVATSNEEHTQQTRGYELRIALRKKCPYSELFGWNAGKCGPE